ncbi:MAG: hypothetical protein VXW18_12170 [Pseudomonadota bacterium]|nr:hypothetical protein [Pseudomonadota bacterium]
MDVSIELFTLEADLAAARAPIFVATERAISVSFNVPLYAVDETSAQWF